MADAATDTVRAELGAAGEAVSRYRERIAGLVSSVEGNEELVAAMWEVERGLLGAQRLISRAEKIAR
ncbi:MAG: hypothetical protein ACO3RB_05140 [Ilumatobacteraceae bacterium]|jgi:hypothetical protein